MTRTLVGTFTRTEKAELAVDDLTAAGLGKARISLSPAVRNDANIGWPPQADGDAPSAEQVGGSDDEARYTQAMRMGWTVLTVEVDEQQADAAADVLRQAGVMDLGQLPS